MRCYIIDPRVYRKNKDFLFQIFTVFLILLFSHYGFSVVAMADEHWNKLDQECTEGDCMNGKGTMQYYGSQKYIGQFKNGKRHGLGILFLPLNSTIEGKWVNDEMVKGTATLPDGAKYEGTWEYGYRHGKGKLIYPNGRVYIGEFHGGNKHGQGTMMYPDGRVYVGEYVYGKRSGLGTMSYPDGRKITGQFLDGKFLGESPN